MTTEEMGVDTNPKNFVSFENYFNSKKLLDFDLKQTDSTDNILNISKLLDYPNTPGNELTAQLLDVKLLKLKFRLIVK